MSERTRTMDLDPIVHQVETHYSLVHSDSSQNVNTPSAVNDVVTTSGNIVMNDIVTEDYWAKVKSGQIIINPMTKTHTVNHTGYLARSRDYSLSYDLKNGTPVTSWTTNDQAIFSYSDVSAPSLLPLPSTIDVDYYVNQQVLRCWAEVTSAPIQVYVSAIELKETYDFVVDIILSLWEFAQAGLELKKQVAKGWITYAKAADIWLSWRYAIRPLIGECNSAIEAYNQIVGNNSRRMRFQVSKFVTSVNEDEVTHDRYTAYNHLSEAITYARNSSRTLKVSAGMICGVRGTKMKVIDTLGLDEFLSSAWELVPFSFVLDWFVNVGTWLQAWSPTGQLLPLGGWTTTVETVAQTREVVNFVHDYTAIPPYYGTGTGTLVSSSKDGSVVTTKTRNKMPARSEFYSFNIKLNNSKVLDLLAIVNNSLRNGGLDRVVNPRNLRRAKWNYSRLRRV